LSESTEILTVLCEIGTHFGSASTFAGRPCPEQFDVGLADSIYRALVLGNLIHSLSYDLFREILNSDPAQGMAVFGLLLVLSVRLLDQFRDQKVSLLGDGSIWRLANADAYEYRLVRSDGIEVAFDRISFAALPLPFDVVPVDPFGALCSEFVQRIYELSDHPNMKIARFASFSRSEVAAASTFSGEIADKLMENVKPVEGATGWARDTISDFSSLGRY
jgi:hypothetical protein